MVARKPTVLIIDDEKSIVETVSAVLNIRGFEVLEAFSGEQGRRVLEKEGRPDLIVLDVLLPGVNGLDLCKQIKENPRLSDVSVILITVITQDSEVADGFWKIGTKADDFVSKPFDPFDLADRIEKLLGRAQGRSRALC
jgi:two-component system, OmpR family, response regulator MprA